MTRSKRDLAEQINTLEKHEQENIFQIVQRHNIQHSKNGNGVFINMKNLTPVMISEIEMYLESIKEQKARMTSIIEDHQRYMQTSHHTPHNIPILNDPEHNDDAQPQKHDTVVQQFIGYLSMDKSQTKKNSVHSKFQTAKKRYARAFTHCDTDTYGELLEVQEYLV
jgi:Bromodomain extra-terminal - transcription regulation